MSDGQTVPARRVLFISHANPADNAFATWIGSRLSAIGFEVWVDLYDLSGGSKHWNEIESTIRNRAAKVLVVTSRSSRKAEGVENEIMIAKGVEKELQLNNFIIQLKVDDLPYTQLPPALNNRIAINFERNWGGGLEKLLEQFREEGLQPAGTDPSNAAFFASVLRHQSDSLTDKPEPVFLNWLPITLPEHLYVYTFTNVAKLSAEKSRLAGVPAYVAGVGKVISFAAPQSMGFGTGSDPSSLRYIKLRPDEWLNDPELSATKRVERRRELVGLLNAAWEIELASRSWSPLRLSNELAYFVPVVDGALVKQPYRDPLGRRTRPVTLAGQSKRYAAYWHAAVSARAVLSPITHYAIRLHVGFTDDGYNPIADGDRAFRLRRTFCKAFWNDRWRRIYFAIFERLADGMGHISIKTGGDEPVRLAFPQKLMAPYSIASDLADGYEESDDDIVLSPDEDLLGDFVEFSDPEESSDA